MAEYIEREALEKFIENGLNNPNKESAFGHDAIEILAELHHMPAADVEPVRHGRWLYTSSLLSPFRGVWICSCCSLEDENGCCYSFCPNCGAKMDLEAENG